MKKSLIAFILSLSCLGAMAFVGCGENTSNSSSSPSTESSSSEDISSPEDSSSDENDSGLEDILPGEPAEIALDFEEGEGFTYGNVITVGLDGVYTLGFTVELGGFYLDSVPLVYVDDVLISPIEMEGLTIYTSQVNEGSKIRVENVKRDVSNMQGDGTFENAFLVTKPIDLLYIAEQVNKGVARYVQGSYVLGNDIDCKGAELKVIGDLSTPNSYFSGCFSCYTEPETGVMERYTISNFTINSQNANYVGLFGAVQSDYNVTSSALFYGIRLDNFVIEANLYNVTSASKTLAVGSLVGYGAGANMYLCEATNGTINLSGDSNYFSFAGGLIGYQQAFLSTMGQYCASEIAYANVDVDVNIVSGMTLYAGGIVGYMNTTYPLVSVASVHNSYATGDVAGALRAGGIVGGLGQFSVVNNSYAANDVSAICYQNKADGMASSDEYYYANAGGLVGFAENDSIVHDCFHNGSVDAYAISGESYAVTDALVGGGYEKNDVSPVSEKYIALDCLSNIDLKEIDSKGGILNTQLGWESYDWIFTKNDLPSINFDTSEGTITRGLTLEYVTKNVSGEMENVKVNDATSLTRNYLDTSNSSANSYVTMGSFFAGGGLDYYYTADNGYVSYGYYFDKECTLPVPYAYMPTKNVTLYIGFYDLSDIAGDYYFTTKDNETVKINLGKDGYVTYQDGASEHKTNYTYNGEKLVLESVRLARYFDGDIVIGETDEFTYADPNFDVYRYTYHNFVGAYADGKISLYDGTYFTQEAPLVASNTLPEATEYDAFYGEWAKSANVRKVYTFDGKGNWTYSYDGVEKGEYLISSDGQNITFTRNNVEYRALFNQDGLLEIYSPIYGTEIFNRNYGYLGLWTGTDTYYGDFVLDLGGIGKDGKGVATLTYENGLIYNLVYERSETDGYVALYEYKEDAWKGDVFGYFSYNAKNHTLSSVLYDTASPSYYTPFTLQAIDDYEGEWICNAQELLNVEFNFDGIGLYANLGTQGKLTITEDGVQTVVTYTLDKFLKGTFTYKNLQYTITYDEDQKIVHISYAENSAILERKDVFANKTFIDADGNEYVFDGRSNLSSGGKLTINGETEYLYRNNGEEFVLFDGATILGSIALNVNHYDLTMNGKVSALYIKNELMGEWAMRGQYDIFTVNYEDTEGYLYANFRGYDVKMSHYDTNVMTFSYKEGKMPFTYYVFIYEDAAAKDTYLFITEYADLSGDDVIYCSRISDLYGTWKWNKDPSMAITFDGIAYSYLDAYSGIAKQTRGAYSTDYYYHINNGKLVMYSQTTLQGRTWYYHVTLLKDGDEGYAAALTDTNSWVSDNGTVLVRTEVDSLFAGIATDANDEDVTYSFDYTKVNGKTLGAICVEGEVKYTYVMDEVTYNNASREATIEATDVATGKRYLLILDYSNEDGKGDLLTIGAEITDEVTE